MKNVRNLILGLGIVLCSTAFGQRKVQGYGTYVPSKDITIMSSDQPQVYDGGSGETKIIINDILVEVPGNQVPDNPTNIFCQGGPVFYSNGPGGASMTCFGSGICAEMSNTTYYIWYYE